MPYGDSMNEFTGRFASFSNFYLTQSCASGQVAYVRGCNCTCLARVVLFPIENFVLPPFFTSVQAANSNSFISC